MTSDNETNLLTHLFSLCLKIDDYATDTTLVAADLKISPTRYVTFFLVTYMMTDRNLPDRVNDLFKSLGTMRISVVVMMQRLIFIKTFQGCTISKLSPQDLKRLALPDSAGQEKRAILKAPLTFPKPRLKRRA